MKSLWKQTHLLIQLFFTNNEKSVHCVKCYLIDVMIADYGIKCCVKVIEEVNHLNGLTVG